MNKIFFLLHGVLAIVGYTLLIFTESDFRIILALTLLNSFLFLAYLILVVSGAKEGGLW